MKHPNYDWTEHDFKDFERASRQVTAPEIQAQRLGRVCTEDQLSSGRLRLVSYAGNKPNFVMVPA